ncbi:DUF5074 domain-containing protein [Chitinophaga vietnamensis]|uniref:DUF5074 domain-containing protein n=1 Tax=Chitinophaga vietnamensis TaxID=2593957 RepID=UPI0011774869|nr:DUF5074 domain-containing protein [Chitinophaga vietnamensis]
MKKKNLLHLFYVLLCVAVVSCSKNDTRDLSPINGSKGAMNAASLPANYSNGFFIANEGWFGHENGDLYFYSYSGDSLVPNVYKAANPSDSLGAPTNTLQYATIFNGKMYIVVKAGGPLVVTDATTMVQSGRINSLPANDGHTFLGIDASRGLLSTGDGVYPLALPGLTLGTKLSSVSGYTGDMTLAGNYIFALSQTDGIVALNSTNYSLVRNLGQANLAFAIAKEGSVWAATADSLVRIDASTLARSAVKLPVSIPSPWGAWRHAGICASTVDNVVFLPANNGFAGGTKVYRYVIGDITSLNTPFITLPSGQYFYGCGIAYNKATNELVATTINGPYTGNINRILIYDASSGALKKTITYNGWYFPAMPVFR